MSKRLLAAVLFAVASLGACCARLAQRQGFNSLKLAEAFASGALVNAGLVHLLADASRDLDGGEGRRLHGGGDEDEEEGYPIGALLCGAGCLLTHAAEAWAEALMAERQQAAEPGGKPVLVPSRVPETVMGRKQADRAGAADGSPGSSELEGLGLVSEGGAAASAEVEEQPSVAHPHGDGSVRSVVAGPLLMLALSLHSLLEGLSLGAAKQDQVLHLFIAILVHKGVAAFTLGVAWLTSLPSLKYYLLAMAWFAAVTPAGILIGTGAEGSTAGSVMTALSAGTFLYIGLIETLPGVKTPLLPGGWAAGQALACACGWGVMAVLGLWT